MSAADELPRRRDHDYQWGGVRSERHGPTAECDGLYSEWAGGRVYAGGELSGGGAGSSGSPLVGTTTAVDGSFTLVNVPVGSNIPLVIVAGRWRRQLVIPGTTACTANPLPANFVVMPQDQTQGDIPKIAIATGSVDTVECVLRKVGITDSEFTNPSGTGRINIYSGSGSPGALIDSTTPSQTALMSNATTLNQYDVLMLPCQGGQYTQPAGSLANFISYANAGGRVYSSHYSYVWMYNNPPFNGVANWNVNQSQSLTTGYRYGRHDVFRWTDAGTVAATDGRIDDPGTDCG